MYPNPERAMCVLWYHETRSPKTVQRRFQTEYRKPPPDVKRIKSWYENFKTTGSVSDLPRSGRPRSKEDTVDAVHQSFCRSPQKSVRRASRELHIPTSTVHKILHQRLAFRAYKVQIVQDVKPTDLNLRYTFAVTMLSRIEEDNQYLQRVMFSDEATFHVSGYVNRQNVRIWGSENPSHVVPFVRDSPKVNVWCGLMHNKIIGPFFFVEPTVTGDVYLDMLQLFVGPQLEEHQPRVILQQDGAPPHWSSSVRQYLDDTFPDRWIGRDGPTPWPPRSPDITPLDFFLWGYVKDSVFRSPVPDIRTLQDRISAVIASIPEQMLANVWREVDYRLEVLRATKGAHVEVY